MCVGVGCLWVSMGVGVGVGCTDWGSDKATHHPTTETVSGVLNSTLFLSIPELNGT